MAANRIFLEDLPFVPRELHTNATRANPLMSAHGWHFVALPEANMVATFGSENEDITLGLREWITQHCDGAFILMYWQAEGRNDETLKLTVAFDNEQAAFNTKMRWG